jgi:DNA-binding NtrC family response regulator
MKCSDCTLLIAEDNAASMKVYEKAFGRDGYKVLTCDNAAQVMAELRDGKVDLLVTDLEMPKANTLELFPFLKKEYPRLPVIVVSGHYAGLQDEFSSRDYPVAAFFGKPVELAALTEKVKAILKIDGK